MLVFYWPMAVLTCTCIWAIGNSDKSFLFYSSWKKAKLKKSEIMTVSVKNVKSVIIPIILLTIELLFYNSYAFSQECCP